MNTEHDYLIGRIQAALANDLRVNKQDVRIVIRAGGLHLLGQTSTAERREAIGLIAAETAPDFQIFNELTVIEVTGPTADPEVIHD
jgi:hypothetical protein